MMQRGCLSTPTKTFVYRDLRRVSYEVIRMLSGGPWLRGDLMGTGDSPRPTDAELAILNVLWAQGACTVRNVHERLSQDRDMGYTTVLKLMQIMFDKGLVTRDDSQRSHV